MLSCARRDARVEGHEVELLDGLAGDRHRCGAPSTDAGTSSRTGGCDVRRRSASAANPAAARATDA